MYTRKFFLAAILLPLLLITAGLISAFASANGLYIHLMLILWISYGGFSFAAILISRKYHPNALRRFGCRGPINFLFFIGGYLLLEYAFHLSLAADFIGLGGILVFSATYVTILGYLYVLIAEQAYISFLHQQKMKNKYKNGNVFVDGKLRC
jgi:hypothetical protein